MAATAWAQDAGVAGAPPALVQLFPFLLVILVFYFLLWRPEQQKRQEQQRMLADLKRNDVVVLASGIHGRVTALGDDVVTVEISPRVPVQVDRSAVQRIVGAGNGDGREKERGRS